MCFVEFEGGGYVEQLRALQPGERLTLSVSANGSEWNGVTNMIGRALSAGR